MRTTTIAEMIAVLDIGSSSKNQTYREEGKENERI